MRLLQILSKCLLKEVLKKDRKYSISCCCCSVKPQHLICFKNWTSSMVMDIINSAINLKCCVRDTHNKRLDVLTNSKVMILQEVNEPMLNMAVSKAATLLGAYDVNIVDHVVWEHDYYGRVFSYMADAIFVATTTHQCIQRFSEQASVPVLCMKSRTHASIQALATVMSIFEEFGTMRCLNVSWIGPPHPVLNSYLLLCPMLGANIRFKCCCDEAKKQPVEGFIFLMLAFPLMQDCPVSPLLKKASEEMCNDTFTESKQCQSMKEVLKNACIIISGPTPKKEKIKEFQLDLQEIFKNTLCQWIYFHTCPRGKEVNDCLFHHNNARTFCAFENMHFIAAALMAYCIKGHKF